MKMSAEDNLEATIEDLVIDAQCAKRDGLPEYAKECQRKIAVLRKCAAQEGCQKAIDLFISAKVDKWLAG